MTYCNCEKKMEKSTIKAKSMIVHSLMIAAGFEPAHFWNGAYASALRTAKLPMGPSHNYRAVWPGLLYATMSQCGCVERRDSFIAMQNKSLP